MTDYAKRKWPQFLISFLCNIGTLTFGLQVGWLSPLQASLQSENSPLGPGAKPLTEEEISWIGSLPSITITLSSPFFGFCLHRYGRKLTSLIATAPNILVYLLLLIADNVYVVYVARLIGGFCSCGSFMVVSIYVNETAEPHLRGFLGGVSGAFIKIGIILAFILGGFSSYLALNLVSMSFSVVFLLLYVWLPESPTYLMTANRKEEAKQVLRKLRGGDEKLIETELCKIQALIDEVKKGSGDFSLGKFFTERATVTGLIIVCGMFTIQMLCGYPAIVRYTVFIFKDASTPISPHVAAILLAVAQLLTSLIGALILDKVGRKSLIIVSTVVMAISLIILSSYLYMKTMDGLETYVRVLRFLPLIALVFFISGYAMGYGTVPFVIVPELFAPEARGTAATVTNSWISSMEFVVCKLFPTITSWIGLAGSILIFGTNCCVGVLFLYFIMFETNGLEFEEIYRKLNGSGKETVIRGRSDSKIITPFVRRNSKLHKLDD